MTKYALFAGQDHEASGGFGDFVCMGTIEECKNYFDNNAFRSKYYGRADWAHIVHLENCEIVLEVWNLYRVKTGDAIPWEEVKK